MTIGTYTVGQLVRISGAFLDPNGAAADPTTCTLKVMAPSGTVTTYEYGGSPEVVFQLSTGNYYIDLDADESGDYHYKWEGTGTADSTDEDQFTVFPSHF